MMQAMVMKCTRCNRKDAVVELPYPNESMCKACFNAFVERKVRKTIRANKLFTHGDVVGVAVSGGKDSTTCLHILKGIVLGKTGNMPVPICIDEGIKGYRDKALKSIQKYCKMFGLELRVASFKDEYGLTLDQMVRKTRKKLGRNCPPECSICGVFRRSLLNKTARKIGCTKLAFGHNMDDEAQSLLMNIFRGDLAHISRSGPMTGIVERDAFVRRIKPLYDVTERESALYAFINDLPFDSDECPYHHDALRNLMRGFLNGAEPEYPDIKFKMLSTNDRLRRTISKKTKTDAEKIMKCRKCGELTSAETCKACEFREMLDT